MEKLEKVLGISPFVAQKNNGEEEIVEYEGLELIEETQYKGGTGVKYWM